MIGGAHKAFDDAGLDFKKKKHLLNKTPATADFPTYGQVSENKVPKPKMSLAPHKVRRFLLCHQLCDLCHQLFQVDNATAMKLKLAQAQLVLHHVSEDRFPRFQFQGLTRDPSC